MASEDWSVAPEQLGFRALHRTPEAGVFVREWPLNADEARALKTFYYSSLPPRSLRNSSGVPPVVADHWTRLEALVKQPELILGLRCWGQWPDDVLLLGASRWRLMLCTEHQWTHVVTEPLRQGSLVWLTGAWYKEWVVAPFDEETVLEFRFYTK